MPHKRAKRSVREQIRSAQGNDLPPSKQSIANEDIPKSLARVLNAAKIREEWKVKKRKQEEGDEGRNRSGKRQKLDGTGNGVDKRERKKISGILPGESLQHYNKRVEDDMRPLVRDAVQTSLAKVRGIQREERADMTAKKKDKNKSNSKHGRSKKSPESEDESDADPSIPSSSSKHDDRPKDFEPHSSSAPRRLNDIAQAPPDIKRLPRGAAAGLGSGGSGKTAGLSGAGRREGVLSMAQKVMMEEEREKAIARYRQMKAAKRKDGAGEVAEE